MEKGPTTAGSTLLPIFGYKAVMDSRPKESRLQVKLKELGLTSEECKAAIGQLWKKEKPAKIQFFGWQIGSRGLPTGSWLAIMGFANDCNVAVTESWKPQSTASHHALLPGASGTGSGKSGQPSAFLGSSRGGRKSQAYDLEPEQLARTYHPVPRLWTLGM